MQDQNGKIKGPNGAFTAKSGKPGIQVIIRIYDQETGGKAQGGQHAFPVSRALPPPDEPVPGDQEHQGGAVKRRDHMGKISDFHQPHSLGNAFEKQGKAPLRTGSRSAGPVRGHLPEHARIHENRHGREDYHQHLFVFHCVLPIRKWVLMVAGRPCPARAGSTGAASSRRRNGKSRAVTDRQGRKNGGEPLL